MKIAFVANIFPVVSETFVVRHVEGMIRRGHDVTVIAGRWDQALEDFYQVEVPVKLLRGQSPSRRVLDMVMLAGRAVTSADARKQLIAAARAALLGNQPSIADIAARKGEPLGEFDAIIAHFGPAGVRATALQQAGLLKGPIATVFHGFDMSDRAMLARYQALYDTVFEHNLLLLPISRFWQERLATWGAPRTKMKVLRMGVDVDDLPHLPLDRPLLQPMRVLSVARLVEKKGLKFAVQGVARASSPVEFDIIGSGPLESSLRSVAKSSRNPVRFLGRQPHEFVFEALTRADVFLLPSVKASSGDMEGVPVSLMEAMAVGVIVVATRHSGIPELIEDGVNGLLVDERDPLGIARALDRIQSGKIDLPAMRAAARETVYRHFNNAALDVELESICQGMAMTAQRRISAATPSLAPGPGAQLIARPRKKRFADAD